MTTIAFFNTTGGVGKTTLVYHLAWMFADQGIPVLAVDLDPQANLTAMFLNEDRLEEIWPEDEEHKATIFGAVRPILRGIGDIAIPPVERIAPNLGLLPGDLGLLEFGDKLSTAWRGCSNSDEAALRIMTACHRLMYAMADGWADLILIDVGPNLGAINRAAMIASDHVCVPLAPDLYSLQGLKNLGPALMAWRSTWAELKTKAPKDLSIPAGSMSPEGYVVMQHGARDSRPSRAYHRWLDRIPAVYRKAVLGSPADGVVPKVENDPNCLAQLKHYRSLMPLAMEAHKPMFHLKPADGAIGAHGEAVRDCKSDFLQLARKVGAAAGIKL